MNRRSWLYLIVTGLVVSSLFVGGCEKKPVVSTPIKIGFLTSQTGMLAEYGTYHIEGATLALEEAGSQVAGREVQLLIVDDGSTDVPGSVDKTKKLVESDGVCIMITPLFNAIAEAIFPYLDTMKVPNLSMLQTYWEDSKYQYHFSPIGTQVGSTYDLGLYAYDELGYRTMTLLCEDSRPSRSFALGAAAAFKSRGGQVIQEQYYPMMTMDWGPFLTNLKEADCFLAFIPGMAMQFISQYHQFGVKMPFINTGDTIGEEHIAALGDDGLGIIDNTHYTSSIDTPANKKFVAAFQEKHGRAPGGHNFAGYLNILLALAALEATDGDTTPEKLLDALKKVEVDSPSGPVVLGATRYGTITRYTFQIAKENGRYYYKILKTIPNVQPIDESTIPELE